MPDPNSGLTDLQMMLQPHRWPNYNEQLGLAVLPLKHLTATGKAGQGVLFAEVKDGEVKRYTWEWQANLWALRQAECENQRDRLCVGRHELVRLLVESGWMVD